MINKCKKRRDVSFDVLSLSNKFTCLEEEDCFVDTNDEGDIGAAIKSGKSRKGRKNNDNDSKAKGPVKKHHTRKN